MKYMTIMQKFLPPVTTLTAEAPWSGLWKIFGGELKTFGADLLVPLGAAVCIILGIVGIVKCVVSKQRGGEGFGMNLAFTIGAFFVAAVLTAVWTMFASYFA